MALASASDAFDDRWLRAPGNARPAHVLRKARAADATHIALFDGERVQAVVPVLELALAAQKEHLAELVARFLPVWVSGDLALGGVAERLLQSPAEAVVVGSPDQPPDGIVTQRSLLRAMSRQTEVAGAAAARAALEPDILAQTPAILWTTDNKLQITSMSGAELENGRDVVERLLSASVEEGSHRGDRSELAYKMHRRALQGEAVSYELMWRGRWLLAHVQPLRDAQGQVTGCIGVALRNSEQRLQLLAENARDIIYRYRLIPEPGFEYVSPASTAITGYTPEEHYENPELGLQIVHPEDRPLLTEGMHRLTSGPLVLRWIHRDGSVIWTEQHNVPVFDERGNLVALEGIARDITERKLVEQKLRQARDFYLTLLHDLPMLIWRPGEDSTCDYFNRTWLQFTGRTFEEELGEGWLQGVHPDDRDRCHETCVTAYQQRRPFEMEFRLRRHDGQYRWIVEWGYPFKNIEGEFAGFLGAGQDFTDRKSAEETLRASENRYRTLMESANDAICIADAETGRLVDVNRQAQQMFGRSRDELLKMHHLQLYAEQDRARVSMLLQHDIEPHRSRTLDILIVRSDERAVPVEISCGMLEVDGKRLVQAIFHDLSERRQAEEQLQQLQTQLAHMNRLASMGEMASALAHEVNQPLGAIANYAGTCVELLRQGELNTDELPAVLESVHEQALRAGEIIHRLKRFVSKTKPEPTLLDLNALVQEVERLVQHDVLIHRVTLTAELAEDLPQVNVDRVQIQQVLVNLVRNAVEAMNGVEQTGRRLHISTVSDLDAVVVRVCDNGSGIAEGPGEHIFEPYYTTKPDGLGMGLSISRTIVAAHGGTLWATRNAEAGTTFHVRLPVPFRQVRLDK